MMDENSSVYTKQNIFNKKICQAIKTSTHQRELFFAISLKHF